MINVFSSFCSTSIDQILLVKKSSCTVPDTDILLLLLLGAARNSARIGGWMGGCMSGWMGMCISTFVARYIVFGGALLLT